MIIGLSGPSKVGQGCKDIAPPTPTSCLAVIQETNCSGEGITGPWRAGHGFGAGTEGDCGILCLSGFVCGKWRSNLNPDACTHMYTHAQKHTHTSMKTELHCSAYT